MDTIYQFLNRNMNIDNLRKAYTGLYDYVRNLCLNSLKLDANFKDIYSDEKLCGSYADKLKIIKPNEFDLVLRFKLPETDSIEISCDETHRGNVFINLTEVMKKIEADYEFRLHEFFKSVVDSDGFLLVNEFQKWLEGLMSLFMRKIENKITFQGNEYKLLYEREGPAHTVYVMKGTNTEDCLLSIDFVPGFIFSSDRAKTKRPLKDPTGYWEAIPKPLKCTGQSANGYRSFRTSYTHFERLIIRDKHHLKNTLKLMKKYRDLRPELEMLKSYYIKTLFLWMCEDFKESFWEIPPRDIMIKVFELFDEALKNKEIKFYWDSSLNLLEHLPEATVTQMRRIVAESREILVRPFKHDRDILLLFLSQEEIRSLTPEMKKIMSDSTPERKVKSAED